MHPGRMRNADPVAHLRVSLERHRTTLVHLADGWCVECGVHRSDDSGLCPVCRPSV